MARTITVSEEVYKMLKRFRRRGESFSNAIKRAITRSTSISDIIGIGLFDDEDVKILEGLRKEKEDLDLNKNKLPIEGS